MSEYQIRDEGDFRNYYFQIPNIVDDMELDPLSFRLYCHLKRVAGDNGKCWQSMSTMAQACQMSTGSISKARTKLRELGLIKIQDAQRPGGGKPYQIITITDIWINNSIRYSPDEDQCSPGEHQSSPHEHQYTPGETKNNPIKKNPEEKPKKNNIAVEIPSNINTPEFLTAWQEWIEYRKEIKHKLSTSTMNKQLKKLSQFTPEIAIAMITQSIERGWMGLFEVKTDGKEAVLASIQFENMGGR